jgi:hypothetical protein
MKLLLLYISLFLFSVPLFSQYGNEWFDVDNQEYYKFKIVNEGVYRIHDTVLENAGILVDDILLQNFQLFKNGEEQPIYIKYGTAGLLQYIEFYGSGNDGQLDLDLYDNAASHTNPYYSLINDTATYFLTWNNSLNNLHFEVSNDNQFSNYTTADYCLHDKRIIYSNRYNYGESSDPAFVAGEGWIDNDNTTLTYDVSKTIACPGLMNNNIDGTFDFSIAGISNAGGLYSHHIKIEFNSTSVYETSYSFYGPEKNSVTIPNSLLTESNNIKLSIINDYNLTGDKNAFAYISLTYPMSFDLNDSESFHFILPQSSNTKETIEISNFDDNGSAFIYDFTNYLRIPTVKSSDIHKAVITINDLGTNCYIFSENNVEYIPEITKANLDNYSDISDPDYIIITHTKLWSSAQAYASYRESTGHSVLLVNVEDLYDQFYYGIRKHPLAIRNFLKYLVATTDKDPKYLFFFGKGIDLSLKRHSTYYDGLDLVPAMGQSSDYLYSNGISYPYTEPAMATGRLSALNNEDANRYLTKVKEYESNEPAAWMKKVIHLGGGDSPSQQSTFAYYLSTYEEIITDTLFGASVETFLKTSSDPISTNHTTSIRNRVNDGVSLITFFGHGAGPIGFDLSLNSASTYSNERKYPFVLANSCYVGDIFKTGENMSEDWIFNRYGAIGFLASTNLGYSSDLYKLSKELYRHITYLNYGEGIGWCLKKAIGDVLVNKSIDITVSEFVLHGDPAIVINSFEKPDLQISSADILVDDDISTEKDTFNLKVIVNNNGKGFYTPFYVKIERVFPEDSLKEYFITLDSCLYKDTIELNIPVGSDDGAGLNRINVYVDLYDTIDEISELNNQASLDFIISSSDLLPVYPFKFAIYPNDTLTLIASTVDPFVENLTSIFQIDYTDEFINPIDSLIIQHDGGIVKWKLPFELEDSTVYYWRVSNVPDEGEEYRWRESSFIYISGKTGWSQADFYQFKEDNFTYINYNRPTLDYSFINLNEEIAARTVGLASNNDEWSNTYFSVLGALYRGSCQANSKMHVAVLDSITLEPWNYDDGFFGQYGHSSCYSKYFFPFRTLVQSERLAMAEFLNNHVPDGNYVILYSFISPKFAYWEDEVFEAVENLTTIPLDIRDLENDQPYILICKKGSSIAREQTGGIYDTIDEVLNVNLSFSQGKVSTELIGPAEQWTALYWDYSLVPNTEMDSVLLDLIGYKNDGTTDLLIDDLSAPDFEVLSLDTIVDAATYPYVQMQLSTVDDSTRVPCQIDKWQLTYEEPPETALNPQAGYFFYTDSVEQGDDVFFSMATENIGQKDMDSLLVYYSLYDHHNNLKNITIKRYPPHPVGDILKLDTVAINTSDLQSINTIWVEVNPIDTATGVYDQLEKYHFNNIANRTFYVNTDNINPILDVTFDGMHILDGDIITPTPEILIKLKDENQYLALNDQSLFSVYLTPPDGDEYEIEAVDSLGNTVLFWEPANLPDNSCQLLYTPTLEKDGIYQLRVQAKDVSENASGDNDYKITFEIEHESTITNIFNYPNPFSTSTRFVFELTGSEIPDAMQIQIFTITGKLVKTIDLNDLGNVHIGRNITEYAWDGTDQFGDQLANGVYLYRVQTHLNGESIKKRSTDADYFFKQGIGKMYLMR